MKYIKLFEEFSKEVVLYHGSSQKLNRFDSEKISKGLGNTTYGWGAYFTDSIDFAKEYAEPYLYTIKTGGDYLQLYKTLDSEQKIKVQNAIDGLEIDIDLNVATGWDVYSNIVESIYDSYPSDVQFKKGRFGSSKETSLILDSYGINGLMYKLEEVGTWDGAPEYGHKGYGYVIYNPDSVTITNREDI